MIIDYFSSVLYMWGGWLIIPWFVEFVYTLYDFFKMYFDFQKSENSASHSLIDYPIITIIIQVSGTPANLINCIDSIEKSLYPDRKIRLMLIGDQSSIVNNSTFDLLRQSYPNLSMQWMDSRQGYNRALNIAIYNAAGDYVFTLTSLGELHPLALRNIVSEFENNLEKDCIFGTVLTKPRIIRRNKERHMMIVQLLEFIQTIHGSFCSSKSVSTQSSLYSWTRNLMAFRKSSLMKTQVLETNKIYFENSEESMTFSDSFQKADVCVNALFYMHPSNSVKNLFDKMATLQTELWKREWQRIQSGHSWFTFSSILIRSILCDGIYALPKIIWFFSVLVLMFFAGYTAMIPGALVWMYLLYVLLEYLRRWIALSQMSSLPELNKFYSNNSSILFLYPLFSFITSVFALKGLLFTDWNRQEEMDQKTDSQHESVLSVMKKDWEILTKPFRKKISLKEKRIASEKPQNTIRETVYE